MRGRATRRAGGKADSFATSAETDGAYGDEVEDMGSEVMWKVELENIMQGTHPALVEALDPHGQKMKQILAQADRIRQLQIVNIKALFDCEKKQADDENKVRVYPLSLPLQPFPTPNSSIICVAGCMLVAGTARVLQSSAHRLHRGEAEKGGATGGR